MSSSVVRPRPFADFVSPDPGADDEEDEDAADGGDDVKAVSGRGVTAVLRKQTVAGLEGFGGGSAGGRLGGSRNHTGAVFVLSRKRKQFQV